tara:strand:+ start:14538 stop:14942 length:405 start_codon:yes stop_codon:yes gene_type:complete
MKKLIVILVLICLFLIACNKEPEESATFLSAILEPSTITSGESTDLILDARNNGDLPITLNYKVTSESEDRVSFQYPQQLAYPLQPGETTGNKIVKVSATSDTVRTDYRITVLATDSLGEIVYAQKELVLTVTN